MTIDEAHEYVAMAHESEGEQRAEYGMGAVSLGYDPNEWSVAYDGYRTADDPTYQEAQRIIAAYNAERALVVVTVHNNNDEDIPF
jgi:hypothetical protein